LEKVDLVVNRDVLRWVVARRIVTVKGELKDDHTKGLAMVTEGLVVIVFHIACV